MPKRALTLSMLQANIYSIPIIVILTVVFLTPYFLLRGFPTRDTIARALSLPVFLLSLFTGCLLHEILHALGFFLLGRIKIQDIKIGFQKKTLTPYAHCGVPVPLKAYRLSLLAPFILLAFLPWILAVYLNLFRVLLIALVMAWLAAGDLLFFWKLRKEPAEILVQDHPVLAGCFIIDK